MTPQARRRALGLLAALLVVLAIVVILLLPPPGQGTATGPLPLDYLGVRSCAGCHAEETGRWQGSHHDLAIQKPDAIAPVCVRNRLRFIRLRSFRGASA